MSRTFSGRAIIPGEWTGPCVVSRRGMNTLASFQKGALADKKSIVCSDQNNPDLYDKVLTGRAVCLPKTIGSTTGGMVLQTVARRRGTRGAPLLRTHRFARGRRCHTREGVERLDVVTRGRPGDEFLRFVEDGMSITIKPTARSWRAERTGSLTGQR